MENHIKTKKQKTIMNRLILILGIFLTLFTTPLFAQDIILHYPFDEGTGTIAFDYSGNNYDAILLNGASLISTTYKFGSGTTHFFGTNDISLSTIDYPLNESITISFWSRAENVVWDNIFFITDSGGNNLIRLDIDPDGNKTFYWSNTTQDIISQNIANSTILNADQYYFYTLLIDFQNETLDFYINGSEIYNNLSLSNIYSYDNPVKLTIGESPYGSYDFDGYIDEFYIFDFILNNSQIQELYTANNITLEGDGETIITINGTQEYNIINSHSPTNGSSVSTPTIFTATLNTLASCDLYINNSLYSSYNNLVSFSDEIILNNGNYQYKLYCYYVDNNNILNYEFSNTTYFNVDVEDSQINFQIIGNDFTVSDFPLYITSPCLNEGQSAIGLDEYVKYRAKYNTGGVYWAPVGSNGIATLNLTPTTHEFCLFNGRVSIYGEGKTSNYTMIQPYGNLKIGELQVPNNITTTIVTKVDQFEIFEITNPKAWGVEWNMVILGLILFIIGLALLLVGGSVQSKGAVVMGALMIMTSLGFQLDGLIFGVLI